MEGNAWPRVIDVPDNFCRIVLVTCTTETSCMMEGELHDQASCLFFAALARDEIPILFATI